MAYVAQEKIERILVLGSPGAGKTTFANMLGEETGIPVYHLDDTYWGRDWARPKHADWISKQKSLVSIGQWIIDGNYIDTIPLRVKNAQIIVILDVPVLTCLCRVMARAWRIRRGQWQYLPEEIREQARAGKRVRASKDFLSLVWTILWFRVFDKSKVIQFTKENGRVLRVIGFVPGIFCFSGCSKFHRIKNEELLILPLLEASDYVIKRVISSQKISIKESSCAV